MVTTDWQDLVGGDWVEGWENKETTKAVAFALAC